MIVILCEYCEKEVDAAYNVTLPDGKLAYIDPVVFLDNQKDNSHIERIDICTSCLFSKVKH